MSSKISEVTSMRSDVDGDASHSLAADFVADLNANASRRPIVIGLYGISASGKSFLLDYLRQELGQADFMFVEGSEKIASLVQGGLTAFNQLDEEGKSCLRRRAIDEIKKESARSGQVAIVTGHLMFWSEEQTTGQTVWTINDATTFTHIVYLKVPAELIAQRHLDDKAKNRSPVSVNHLQNWQEAEVSVLIHLCHKHHILLSLISEQDSLLVRVPTLIRHFQQGADAQVNTSRVLTKLDRILSMSDQDQLETMMVMDADKTLVAEDTGALFWKTFSSTQTHPKEGYPLQQLFSSALGYSDLAFHQATLLYEDSTNDDTFEALCDSVASSVTIHPEFISLLQLTSKHKQLGALIVTCGLGLVWEKVLEREGLSNTVSIIGGGRISDGFVVTPAVKAAIVAHLRDAAHLYVWAFGDSPLDLPMLMEADEAIVVVGDEPHRSFSMDAALSKVIEGRDFEARQVLLPSHVQPRLNEDQLPVVRISDQSIIDSIMQRRHAELLHATARNAAKLLMCPTRNASIAGPALRQAHHNIGRYLAIEFVSELVGTEEYSIPHVQGHQTTGHRLRDEHRTSIFALMRGGEPMAFGVNEVFPSAMFIHAASASDIKYHHLECQSTAILVDSVVNSGKTLIQFVDRIRELNRTIRIVVVTGVVQAEVVVAKHALAKLMRRESVSMVALRLSENKFTGTKTTDTGNRLFNTTHLA